MMSFSRAILTCLLIWTLQLSTAISSAEIRRLVEPCIFETCTCTLDRSNLSISVHCQNPDDTPATPNYFPKRIGTSSGINISDFIVTNYDFNQIPDNAFEGLAIESLLLYKNNLKKFTKNCLKGILKLEWLYNSGDQDFEGIEQGALDPAANTLETLELSSLGLDDSKFNAAMAEIQKLKVLESLDLDDNQITTIGPDQFKNLSNLRTLYLNNNRLTRVDINAFSTNPSLRTLYASRNNLTNLKEVFDALKPAAANFRVIHLLRNQITSLAFESVLPNLEVVYLLFNQIESFDNSSLVGSNSLYNLDLSYNKLNFIEDARIQRMVSYSTLQLSNNFLSKVPSIVKTPRLVNFDVSFQNGKLKTINNYAFEREYSPFNLMKLFLEGNDIETFGEKAFCSRYYVPSYITPVTFSYNTMKAIPKCVLKQLSLKPSRTLAQIVVAKPTEPTTDYSDVCNCDLLSFSLLHGMNITGVCQSVFNTLDCNHTGYQDPCAGQTQYECIAEFTTTTTSTTTTVRRTTATTSSSSVTSRLPLTIYLLSFLSLLIF